MVIDSTVAPVRPGTLRSGDNGVAGRRGSPARAAAGRVAARDDVAVARGTARPAGAVAEGQHAGGRVEREHPVVRRRGGEARRSRRHASTTSPRRRRTGPSRCRRCRAGPMPGIDWHLRQPVSRPAGRRGVRSAPRLRRGRCASRRARDAVQRDAVRAQARRGTFRWSSRARSQHRGGSPSRPGSVDRRPACAACRRAARRRRPG